MKIIHRFCFVLLFAISMAGCASESQFQQLDPDAFLEHFAAQSACKAFIDSLVIPVAVQLSEKKTPEEMRSWLSAHPQSEFSALVAKVQRDTLVHGPLDPRRESDQLAIAEKIFEVLRDRPDFGASSCGSDVREFVMESLYLGLGGNDAPVSVELRQRGIEDSWEQRWVLLVTLMAGKLVANSR